jgi:hypothetical protein
MGRQIVGFLSKIFKPIGKALGFVLKPALKLLKKWLVPKVEQPERQALDVPRFGSANAIPIVYGTVTVGGIITDLNVTDSPGGILNENLHMIVVFCVGEVSAVEAVFFNGEESTLAKYAGKFTMEIKLGAPGQTGFASAVGKLNRYDATTGNFPGLCVAYITLIQDADQTVWNGLPEITARIRGRKVIDPRYGTINPFTNYPNPATCLLDYIKDPVWGAGLTDNDIDINSFINVIEIAETMGPIKDRIYSCGTDISGNYVCTDGPVVDSTAPRYTLNIAIDTSRSVFDNMTDIANVYRGYWPDSDGRIKIASETEGDPVFFFSEANIIDGSLSMSQTDISERYNRCTVRFVDNRIKPLDKEVSYPEAGSTLYTTWLAEDNGIDHELTLDSIGTTSPHEALQLAEIAVKSSRNNMQISFSAFPEATECDIGDIISIAYADFGWTGKEFRISGITYRGDGSVDIEAVQHEDGIYPWSETDYSDITDGSNLGDPNNPAAPTGLSLTPDKTFSAIGTLSWNYVENAFVRKFLVVYYHVTEGAGLDPFDYAEIFRAETIGRDILVPLIDIGSPGEDGFVLEMQVAAISTTGVASGFAATQVVLNYPEAPTSLNLVTSNFEMICAPSLDPGQPEPLGTSFNIELLDKGIRINAVRSVTFTGLRHSTTYSVRAQTVNAFGASPWLTQSATTTANADDIIDLIGEDLIESVADIVLPPLIEKIDELADTYDARQLIPEGVVDAFKDLDTDQNVIKEVTTRREETREITAELTILTADFSTEQSVRNAQYTELTTAIATEEEARVTQYELLSAVVDGNSASISTTQEALATETTARATEVSRLDADIAGTNGNVSALVVRVGNAEADIDGNASAIAGIRVAVAGVNSQSQAELILSATVTNAETAIARAYLGVTSTSGGVSRINGIIIDGETNRLEFRSETVLFTDTAGNPSIYFDNALSRFVFNGNIVASTITGSTLQTAESGIRTLLSPSFPIWYGTGAPGSSTPYFSCSISGQILMTAACFIRFGSTTRLQSDASNWFLRCGNGDTVEMDTNFKVRTGTDSFWPFGLDVDGVSNFMFGTNTGLSALGLTQGLRGSGSSIGVEGVSTSGIGVKGDGSTWDFYADGTGTYGPFTGGHDALILKSEAIEQGMIVCDRELIGSSCMSNTITRINKSSAAHENSAVGVFVNRSPLTAESKPAALKGISDDEYAALSDIYDLAQFNAIGEGMMLVCNAGGDIRAGDYITSSSVAGIGKRQDDDLMHSYTVAKARQNMTFTDDGPRMIAVIYHAG